MIVPSLSKQKTFVQALHNACDIPLSQLLVPCLKGDVWRGIENLFRSKQFFNVGFVFMACLWNTGDPRAVLFSIARGIGIPLLLDDAILNRSFGQYARVLVDVDLMHDLRDQIG
ncbi:hypothetical protein JHK82_052222 [Glycine max]|uniref:Uncharacterized protein n=2 Tax=Glycine subgen. Soja TaxID=1462606 RepID=A0A0R0EH49_SOYBN|nr:hypothetical protein JHK86_052050 [Glycine max]KAG4926423.1 hypothetical protein JHK85_052909 [Glycine max]KAG5082059.1 hypothetical protein JHK84_052097 [Glycine max]KAG5084825.1 hypothetical protein JHK82_052222 [Glycine max]RZB46092.1 hypothetical protein D0Y65_050214 [Glycine soja]